MNRTLSSTLVTILVGSGAHAVAQSNAVAGRDLAMEDTWELTMGTRSGTFPNGVGAVGAWTTCCNPGTSAIEFQQAMSPNHAFIHFIVARLNNGRLEQISNRGYVKHTFGSSNDPSSCGNCAGSGRFSWVEVGCSDTYAGIQARDHFNLGPPDEVDPWLGTWVPACSLFDRGDPAVGASQICDGNRSLSQSQANALNVQIHNQTLLRDVDLDVATGQFFFQSGYLVPGEPAANRLNNLSTRGFTPTWTGSNWSMADHPDLLGGTILYRFPNSTVTSATNGNNDGRFYVAANVTGPINGIYHYEYAVHNADNRRGLGALRIPVCPTAQVTGFGFRDIDQDPLNQWTGSKVGSEVVFTTSANPLRWNSIFNFWFDTDAAPVVSSLSLDQYDLGVGASTVLVSTRTPGGIYNENLGPGCGSPIAPTMFAAGSPDRATLPNPTFQLRSKDNAPLSLCVFTYSLTNGTTTVAPGCTAYTGDLNTLQFLGVEVADSGGVAVTAQPVPNTPSFEGQTIDVQAANLVVGGAWLGEINLSNGLRLRLGNQISGCP